MKPLIVIQGPITTRSGYGNHTRDLALSLIKADKYEIKIVSVPWGATPTDALEYDNEDHIVIGNCILTQNLDRQPDIFIQVSVPNEFGMVPGPDGKFVVQKIGKYNSLC